MAKYVVKSDKEVGYSGENQAIAESVFKTFCDLVKTDPSHGTIMKITDGDEENAEKYRPTNEELQQGQTTQTGEKTNPEDAKSPATAEAGMGVSETKLAKRMPLLENLRKVYKGGKLITEGEEATDPFAGVSDEDLKAQLDAEADEAKKAAIQAEIDKRAAGNGGAAKPLNITELKEIPEDELTEISEGEEEANPFKELSDEDLTAKLNEAEKAPEDKKDNAFIAGIKAEQEKRKTNEGADAENEYSKLSDEELATALGAETDEAKKALIQAEVDKRSGAGATAVNEAINPEELKVGDNIKLNHKTDGEIKAKVKSIKDKRIYWANDKGQMGSLSFETAIKKIGKPGPKPKEKESTSENKRKHAFSKK